MDYRTPRVLGKDPCIKTHCQHQNKTTLKTLCNSTFESWYQGLSQRPVAKILWLSGQCLSHPLLAF